jgi:hypothetical protein
MASHSGVIAEGICETLELPPEALERMLAAHPDIAEVQSPSSSTCLIHNHGSEP